MPTATTKRDRAAKAREEFQRRAAVRALDDPATLARAARIVREALARKKLTLADLDPSDSGGQAA